MTDRLLELEWDSVISQILLVFTLVRSSMVSFRESKGWAVPPVKPVVFESSMCPVLEHASVEPHKAKDHCY